MTLSILGSDSSEGLAEAFLALPGAVYAGDRHYCAPTRDSVLAVLDRDDFRGAQRVLVAFDRREPVARVIARLSPALHDEQGRPLGMLGLFEALNRQEAVRELLDAAIDWLAERGAGEAVGPMDGDTWHSYRLNAGPWDRPPFLLEPYNPDYYPRLWEDNGFAVLQSYHSSRLTDLAGAMRSLEDKRNRVIRRGYRLERLRLDRFDRELDRLHALSVEIFRDNFLYSEISRERFVALYRAARRLVDPDLVRFAVAPDGSDAGFLFAYPDRFRAVAAMRGRRGPMALLRYLALRNRVEAVNLKTLGVLPAHRRSGIGAALMYEGYRTAVRQGYRKVNLCLFMKGNPSGGLEGGRAEPLRTYHLYTRQIDD